MGDSKISSTKTVQATPYIIDSQVVMFFKIPSFDYEISLCGKVKKVGNNKLLRLDHNRAGYPRVRIMVNRQVYRLMIHRILAPIFLDNPENEEVVNHLNFNRKDFSLSNLQWVSQSGNIQHYYDNKR